MLPDPIKIMGFMSPGVSRGGGGWWDGEDLCSWFLLFHLCRHADPESPHTCCHAGKITAQLNAKWIPPSEVKDASSGWRHRKREREGILGFQPARGSQDKRDTLFTAEGLLCLCDGEEREIEGEVSPQPVTAGEVMLDLFQAAFTPNTTRIFSKCVTLILFFITGCKLSI